MDINMTRYVISFEGFGQVAEIWKAEACGHFAFDAGGVEENLGYTDPATHSIMKLLRKLKKDGLITADNTTERLMLAVEEHDESVLFRGLFHPELPQFSLGVRYKNGKFTETHIHL